jgi:hypothetical protein
MNKSEKQRFMNLQEIGCIVCRITGLGITPPEIHHLIEGGRRLGNGHTIPLCLLHHRGGNNTAEYVSRHPHKAEFEKRYGTEVELLEKTNELIECL